MLLVKKNRIVQKYVEQKIKIFFFTPSIPIPLLEIAIINKYLFIISELFINHCIYVGFSYTNGIILNTFFYNLIFVTKC